MNANSHCKAAFAVFALALTITGCGSSESSSTKGVPLAVDEFRSEIIGEDFQPKKTFYDKYGKPERIEDLGEDTYLYYQCSDGTVRVKCPQGPFQYDDTIAPVSVDRQ